MDTDDREVAAALADVVQRGIVVVAPALRVGAPTAVAGWLARGVLRGGWRRRRRRD